MDRKGEKKSLLGYPGLLGLTLKCHRQQPRPYEVIDEVNVEKDKNQKFLRLQTILIIHIGSMTLETSDNNISATPVILPVNIGHYLEISQILYLKLIIYMSNS